jgi:hypothetical protein
MRNRASLLTIARAAALLAAVVAAAGCTHASANLAVDSPKMLPYQAPDVDDITGIDSDDEAAPSPGPGSAQTPHK